MPYSSAAEVPDYVPKSKRRQWLHVFNTEWEKHKDKPQSERERISFSAANSVAGPNSSKKYAKLLQKATDEEAKELSDKLIAAIESEWASLPAEVRDSLQSSMSSGIGQGLLQLEFSNAGLIQSANRVAQAYATERAAELVGMKYDEEGNLIPNPNAQWAISDTTRNRIREIVSDAFGQDTPLAEIVEEIQDVLEDEASENGIFSEARAKMIARTEVMRAQTGGNFTVWQDSGIVKKVKWLTSNLEPCDECLDNKDVERELGKPFPSGVIMPPDHPNCACVLIVTELSEHIA